MLPAFPASIRLRMNPVCSISVSPSIPVAVEGMDPIFASNGNESEVIKLALNERSQLRFERSTFSTEIIQHQKYVSDSLLSKDGLRILQRIQMFEEFFSYARIRGGEAQEIVLIGPFEHGWICLIRSTFERRCLDFPEGSWVLCEILT